MLKVKRGSNKMRAYGLVSKNNSVSMDSKAVITKTNKRLARKNNRVISRSMSVSDLLAEYENN